MILVFAAMEPEVRACFGGGAVGEPRDVAGSPIFESDGLAVCQTGLGRRSHDVATSVLAHFEPDAVLSVGTAGGLNPDLTAGQLLACSHVHHGGMRGTLEETPAFSDERLVALALEVARSAEIEARIGSAVTVDESMLVTCERSIVLVAPSMVSVTPSSVENGAATIVPPLRTVTLPPESELS